MTLLPDQRWGKEAGHTHTFHGAQIVTLITIKAIARIFHEGWPEGGSRPAMARRGIKWTGEHSDSIGSGPFDTTT
uniref:Uncharacterized protein n=1 Tax=Magnetococcus massalia (strain MO-1) TaxID=451514 RepID=A0A1S7LIL1_MAGMO|nr:protein of unknown function [Candidatus Magnetococcus massalia]